MIDWHAFILPPRPVTDTMARMARLMYRAEERGSVEEFGRFYDAWDASYFTAAAIADYRPGGPGPRIDNRRGAK